MTRRSLPSGSRTVTPSASVYLVPSLKMWPTSMTRSRLSGPAALGARLARRHLAQVQPPADLDVPGDIHAPQMPVVLVGAGDHVGAALAAPGRR